MVSFNCQYDVRFPLQAVATAERSNQELIEDIYELLDQSQPRENDGSLQPRENGGSLHHGDNNGSLEAHPEDELMAEGRSKENGGGDTQLTLLHNMIFILKPAYSLHLCHHLENGGGGT